MIRRGYIAGLTIGLVLGLASAAVATFLATGAGSARVEIESLSALSVSDSGADSGLPGETVAVRATVHNPNRVGVSLVSAHVTGAITGCDASGATFSDSSGGIAVPAHGDAENVLLGHLHLPGDLPNGCQGASLSVPLEVTAAFGS